MTYTVICIGYQHQYCIGENKAKHEHNDSEKNTTMTSVTETTQEDEVNQPETQVAVAAAKEPARQNMGNPRISPQQLEQMRHE
jgi:hypothetical protein